MENVVDALKAIDAQMGNQFCLGFFGDPMQRIYMTGIGAIPSEVGWETIEKRENFRCSTSVLNLANSIREGGDQLVQQRGRMIESRGELVNFVGSVSLFILPIDERRDELIASVRSWAASERQNPQWLPTGGSDTVKVLVIVHRMAANRLGFGELYAALNDRAPEKFKAGFLDGTAWPLRPFANFVIPLIDAANDGREFEVMNILRRQSPLLNSKNLEEVDVAARLSDLRLVTQSLQQMMQDASGATTRDVLRLLVDSRVIILDPRFLTYLDLQAGEDQDVDTEEPTDDNQEETEREIEAMDAFLACAASQLVGYSRYINGESPFATQQGVKGAEFDRVLVVLDDDEGTHVQFSYEKYFGLEPLSDRDQQNQRDGRETAVERTRRLFYVCCTRAREDLIVVHFTNDVPAARRRMSELRLFSEESIHLESDLQ